VIATAVGGIPEQINDLAHPTVGDAATGVLVPPADAEAMAHWIQALLADPPLRTRLGEQARADAEARFGSDRMLSGYLQYYEGALNKFAAFEREASL
jgi:glycosyltransferase involved in cell wall biosynthesis